MGVWRGTHEGRPQPGTCGQASLKHAHAMTVRPESDLPLAKRRKKRARATPKERRKARRTINQAFRKIGAETRGRKEKVSTRVRGQMAKVIRKEFLSEQGEKLSARQARDLSKRFSLAGVARRQAARVRTYFVDRKGNFRDNRPGTRGRFITSKEARKRDKLLAYWSSIRMISKAQGVTIAEARTAYKLTGAEPWQEIAQGRTP